jgi:hypothetical protein
VERRRGREGGTLWGDMGIENKEEGEKGVGVDGTTGVEGAVYCRASRERLVSESEEEIGGPRVRLGDEGLCVW